MLRQFKDGLLAIGGGALLALMIDSNSQLAMATSPVFSSWLAHGVGALVALMVLSLATGLRGGSASRGAQPGHSPLWFYLGGIPGAFTVLLAAVAVNGRLSLAGAIALMMVGQVVFGLVSDHFGLLRVPLRRVGSRDLLVVLCVLSGSVMVIFGGAR